MWRPRSTYAVVLAIVPAVLLTTLALAEPFAARPDAASRDDNPASASTDAIGTCPATQVTVLFPPEVAGDYQAGRALFGPQLDETGVTGDVVLADDGTGTATDACEPLINGFEIAGNIALVDRGDCLFTEKVKAAQDVGATAVIVANNAGDEVIPMGGDDPTIVIPSAFIGQTDGQTIRVPPLVQATVAFVASDAGDPTELCSRPSPMGVSVSTTSPAPLLYSGTAGMRVRSLFNPNLKFILSNNHVLGAAAPTLCPDTAAPGTRAIQPSSGDLGFDPGPDPQYVIGATVATVPIDFSPAASNLVDAAIAFTTEDLVATNILGIGNPTPVLALPSPGMAVTKAGRTTRVTVGTVSSVGTTSNVNYGATCGVARFVNQVVITPGTFSDGGDSGSTILDAATLAPVAHLFAGSDTTTIGNPMLFVYLLMRVFVDAPSAANSQTELVQEMQALDYEPEIRRLMDIQAVEEERIFQNAGVVGMGVGLNEAGTGYAFVIYVDQLNTALQASLPTTIEGVPVRIEESGEFRSYPKKGGATLR